MSSLSGQKEIWFSSDLANADLPIGGSVGKKAMPRLLRSFARRAERFAATSRLVRNGVGSLLAAAFIAGGVGYGTFVGGHGPHVVSGAAKAVGLKATDIVISGLSETTEQEVFGALQLGETRSLVGFDADDARARVLALPWVEYVEIRKFYPGKLLVELNEKKAFAVWQQDGGLSVVEQNGKLIDKFGIADLIGNRFANLPHLVGVGAAKNATDILPIAARFPEVAGKVQAYVRVADRRWDLAFADGVKVKLPEYGIGQAFLELARLDRDEDLLSREVSVVDMRVPDRVTLRLEQGAAKERASLVAARLKAMKKAEQNL